MAPYLAALIELRDYEGGTNPILAVLFVGFVIFMALLGIAYLIWNSYKTFRFNQICAKSKMTGEEIGFLKTFMRRMHVKEPLTVITKKGRFDEFMNRVGHYYGCLSLSEQDLLREESVFRSMRGRLHLDHQFRRKQLATSRALPTDYPINVICWDGETQNIFTFNSRVVHNNEFFLGIEPPDQKISADLFQQKRGQLEIAFTRERDAEYLFDSNIVRAVDYPSTMWYISHSDELAKGTPLEPIQIPALVMTTQSDDRGRVDEFNVMLYHLTNKGCTFRCDEQRHPFEEGPRVLISFEIPTGSFTLRGSIINLIKRKGEFLYRLAFDQVEDEDNLLILRYMLDLQKEKKQKNSRRKSETPSTAKK